MSATFYSMSEFRLCSEQHGHLAFELSSPNIAKRVVDNDPKSPAF